MNTISHRVYQTGEGERESDRPRTSENQAMLSSATFRNLMTSPMFGLRIRPSKTNMATQTANTAFSFPVFVDVFGWIYRKSKNIFISKDI